MAEGDVQPGDVPAADVPAAQEPTAETRPFMSASEIAAKGWQIDVPFEAPPVTDQPIQYADLGPEKKWKGAGPAEPDPQQQPEDAQPPADQPASDAPAGQ